MPDAKMMDNMARNIFSGVRKFVYDNDFTLYVMERPESASVSVQAWVKTGSINEGEYLGCGLSHFLEHMLFQGCDGYKGQKCADTVNSLGGNINAYTSYAETVYHIDMPSAEAETAINILCSMLKSPEFPEEKFVSEKQVILRERDMGRDNQMRVLFENLWRSVFKVHPVRHPIIGYHDKIVSVTRDMMVDYYRRRYSPVRSFMVICGNLDAERAAAMVGEKISGWGLGDINEISLPVEPVSCGLRESDTFFKDPLSRIAFGSQSAGAAHPQIAAIDVLYGVLGSSQSSRLVKNLQLERELALSINAFNYAPYFGGMSGVMAICTPDKLGALEKAIREELALVAGGAVTAAEVEREVLQQTTDYLRLLRTNSGLATVLGNTLVTYNDYNAAGVYYDRLSKITVPQVKEAAAAWLGEDQMSIVRQLPDDKKSKPKNGVGSKKRTAAIESKPLRHGGTMVTVPRAQLPLMDICIVIPGGVVMENADNSGISSLLCAMLTAGTKRWTENQLSDFIDSNALDLSISSGNNSIVFKLNCRSDRFEAAMQVLTSIMTEPVFGAKALQREKTNMLEGLKSRHLNPHNVATDKALEVMFGSHPYSLPSCGKAASIGKITAATLRKFYHSCLISDKTIFAIGGSFDRAKVQKYFEELAAALPWNKQAFADTLPPAPVFSERSREKTVKLPREQSVVIVALPGVDNTSPDRHAFDILSAALNGLSSRLFKQIREEAGLAYHTGASFFSGIHRGASFIYAITSLEGVPEVTRLLNLELKRLAEKGLDNDEFAAARRSLIFDNENLQEKLNQLVFQCALAEFYGTGIDSVVELPEIYRKITRAGVNKCIRKYFEFPGKVTVSVISAK